MLPWYHDNIMESSNIKIERVQTGLRIEKKILKVLKGMAEFRDMGTNQLLELILLHAFEGRPCFSKEGFKAIKDLKGVYGLDYDAHDYEKFIEKK